MPSGAVAVRGRVDLIVMGSRGHSGLKGLLFGSMTNSVLAGCTKPLLVLRSAKVPLRDSLTVGIAVDGSRYGQAAVRWAIKHRDLLGAEPRIELIHVLDEELAKPATREGLSFRATPVYGLAGEDHKLAPMFDKVMAGALKLLVKSGMKVTVVRLTGAGAGDAIAAYARKRQLDLLVMGVAWSGHSQVLRAGVCCHACRGTLRQAASADSRAGARGAKLRRVRRFRWRVNRARQPTGMTRRAGDEFCAC